MFGAVLTVPSKAFSNQPLILLKNSFFPIDSSPVAQLGELHTLANPLSHLFIPTKAIYSKRILLLLLLMTHQTVSIT